MQHLTFITAPHCLLSAGKLLLVVGGYNRDSFGPVTTSELLSLDHDGDPRPTCAQVRHNFPRPTSGSPGFAICKTINSKS